MEINEAYEAGYRNGSINYELERCPACKNVADLQEALAENTKLREEFDKMDVWHSKELTAAIAENAKLRELVKDMLRYYAKPNEIDYKREADLLQRAHELGVEVSE